MLLDDERPSQSGKTVGLNFCNARRRLDMEKKSQLRRAALHAERGDGSVNKGLATTDKI